MAVTKRRRLASLGRLQEAEDTARHAVTLDPDSRAALGNLASVRRERGKLDEALRTITRALELNYFETRRLSTQSAKTSVCLGTSGSLPRV